MSLISIRKLITISHNLISVMAKVFNIEANGLVLSKALNFVKTMLREGERSDPSRDKTKPLRKSALRFFSLTVKYCRRWGIKPQKLIKSTKDEYRYKSL